MKICHFCQKQPTVSFNRPKSLHKTKRLVFPNLQKKKIEGRINWICHRCLRTLGKA